MEVLTSQVDGGADGGAEPADEDCDDKFDEVDDVTCDDGLALEDFDPRNGARAMELCQQTKPGEKIYGVVDAKYIRADGSAAPPSQQVGLMDNFGPAVPPRKGARMLALSSGHARRPDQPGAAGNHLCSGYGAGTAPPGFPQDVPGCEGGDNINDDVGLEVVLRAPTNADGYQFEFTFYSFEYPEWVCTTFNDQFIALVNPPPQGSVNGNICFDVKKNPVSVNIAFFQVCAGCPLGTAELQGTGFDVWNDAGATGWLVTQAPVEKGQEIDIRFIIWDTGDQVWDSTVLIDNFKWLAQAGTVTVSTVPVPK